MCCCDGKNNFCVIQRGAEMPTKWRRYYGGFKGSCELPANSWNESLQILWQHIHWELIIKSSWKMLWNLEQNFSIFLTQKTLCDFIIFYLQSLDTLLHCQLLVLTESEQKVFLMPWYCSQWTMCAHSSQGKPGDFFTACRAPTSLVQK